METSTIVIILIVVGVIVYAAYRENKGTSADIWINLQKLKIKMSESFNKIIKIFSSPLKLLIMVGVVVLCFLFYWYEWRPSHISKACSKQASSEAHIGPYYDAYYKQCLERHGIFSNHQE